MEPTTVFPRLDQFLYPKFGSNWDDQMLRERILRHLDGAAVVLDVGAGAGIVPHMNFRGMAARVCGVDLDPRGSPTPARCGTPTPASTSRSPTT